MSTATATYVIAGIDPAVADALRAQGGIRHVADEFTGYPCRQCLRDAEAGDELLLVSHDPFHVDSPYRSASPIFLHATSCAPHVPGPAVPDQLARRQLSVRAFDVAAMMTDAAVVDGHDLGETLARFFADPTTVQVHVHNATRGCWAATVTRADPGGVEPPT